MKIMNREPVVTAAVIVGVIMAFLVMCVTLGWISLDPEDLSAIQAFLAAAAPLILALIGAWWARSKVTPVENPHTEDNRPARLEPIVPKPA